MNNAGGHITRHLAAWALLLLLPAIGLGLSLHFNRAAISSDLLQLLPSHTTDAARGTAFNALHKIFGQALIVEIAHVEPSAENLHRARQTLLGSQPPFVSDRIWIGGESPLQLTAIHDSSHDDPPDTWFWPLLFPQWLEARVTAHDLDPDVAETYSILAHQVVADLNAFLDDPLATVLSSWLPHDPLLLLPSALQNLTTPHQTPKSAADDNTITLWLPVQANPFSREGQSAMLEWQQQAADALSHAFPAATITVQGLHNPAIESEARIRREVLLLNICSAIIVLCLLTTALRHPRRVLALSIPILSAILWGAWATLTVFGAIHILAIGIASVLFGVAVDYGLHVSTHAAANNEPNLRRSFAAIRRPLLIGALSTAFGFAFLLLAPIEAIRQVGVMIPAGVCAALLACRFLLPLTAGPAAPLPPRVQYILETPIPATQRHHIRLLLSILSIFCLFYLIQPTFNDSPDSLQPPAGEQQIAYAKLRDAIIQGDASTPLWLTYATSTSEFNKRLTAAREAGAQPPVAQFTAATEVDPQLIAAFSSNRKLFVDHLHQALEDNGFDSAAFAPALTALANADHWLDEEAIAAAIPAITDQLSGPDRALVGSDSGILFTVYPAPAARPAPPHGTVLASEVERITSTLATARAGMIHWLLAALTTLTLIFCLTIGTRLTPLLVLIPTTAVALPLATLSLLGGITLLALLGGIMGFCLALDYAAFTISNRPQPVPSVRLSALTTGSVFAVLAFSSIPAVSQMGITVAAAVAIGALAAEAFGRG